jgi:phage-related protein
MGLNAMTLRAVLGLDKKEYDKGLDDAEKQASSFGSKLKSSISTTGKVIGGVTSIIGKAVAAGTTLASGVATKIGKSALDAYANYEQLIGGVETLFKDSAKVVQDNAAKAFQTAGMDANSYMELATGFSASLIQSLKGDTAKAAEVTDRAIQDMSDNANKFGTDIESIKNAYQGFSKQNYTMLDNLKLGYGGTKEEMQRLIREASKMKDAQKELNISVKEGDLSFANIANAISVVQKNLGIAGATADEAGSTIEGSVKAMKASWQNLLVGIADDTQPFGDLVDKFVGSLITAGNNIMPRIEQILGGIGKLVETLIPKLINRIPSIISDVFPRVLETLKSIAGTVENTILMLINMASNFLANNAGSMVTGIIQFITRIVKMLPQILQPIIKQLPKIIKDIAKALKQSLPELIAGVTDLLVMLAQAFPEIIMVIVDVLPDLINRVMDAVIDNLPIIIDALIDMVGELIKHLPEIIKGLIAALPKVIEAILVGFGSLASGIISLFTDIDLGEVLGGMIDIVGETFAGIGLLFTEPGEALKRAFDGVKEYGIKVFQSLADIVEGIFELIENSEEQARAEESMKQARESQKKKWQEAVAEGDIEYMKYLANAFGVYDTNDKTFTEKEKQEMKMQIGGTLEVKGVNNQGELVGVADYTMDELSKKLERDQRMYGYAGG